MINIILLIVFIGLIAILFYGVINSDKDKTLITGKEIHKQELLDKINTLKKEAEQEKTDYYLALFQNEICKKEFSFSINELTDLVNTWQLVGKYEQLYETNSNNKDSDGQVYAKDMYEDCLKTAKAQLENARICGNDKELIEKRYETINSYINNAHQMNLKRIYENKEKLEEEVKNL